ncbi:MAG: hypothetical protein ACTSWL_05605 [Promethearchaeota archaeon]
MQFPVNHYESLPHLRLSKKKFLAIENGVLYKVKVHEDESLFTAIFRVSEIQKIQVQMLRSKNSTNLILTVLPRFGKKKNFSIHPIKFARYTRDDWVQIPKFLKTIDFQAEPLPINLKGLDEIEKSMWVTGPYRFFSSKDKIFQLLRNPEFVEEVKGANLSFLGLILTVFGGIMLIIIVLFAFLLYAEFKTAIWIISPLSLLFLLIGIPKIMKNNKNKKMVIEKYDIGYYFK